MKFTKRLISIFSDPAHSHWPRRNFQINFLVISSLYRGSSDASCFDEFILGIRDPINKYQMMFKVEFVEREKSEIESKNIFVQSPMDKSRIIK